MRKRLRSFANFFQSWVQRNWQPLLALFGVYVPLAIFGLLAIQIWQLEGGLWWDVEIMRTIHATARPSLDLFASGITNFGTRWGVFPAAAVMIISLLVIRRWRLLTYCLITLLGCSLMSYVAKTGLHRLRPSLWEYVSPTGFSFPSGHAMSSMVFVAVLSVLTWHTRWRGWILTLGSLFVVVIGWTRLYLGVHYPSDILAGWMLSLAWAVGVSLVVKPHFSAASISSTAAGSEYPSMTQQASTPQS